MRVDGPDWVADMMGLGKSQAMSGVPLFIQTDIRTADSEGREPAYQTTGRPRPSVHGQFQNRL